MSRPTGNRDGNGPTCLVLGGMFATGKSSTARALAAATGAEIVEIGEVIRERCGNTPILQYMQEVFDDGDFLTWVREAISRAAVLPGRRLIVVGPRTPEEIAFLRARFPSCLVVTLVASAETRRARWRRREKPEIPSTYWGLREERELRWGQAASVAPADWTVDSDRPLDVVVAEILDRWRDRAGPDLPTAEGPAHPPETDSARRG